MLRANRRLRWKEGNISRWKGSSRLRRKVSSWLRRNVIIYTYVCTYKLNKQLSCFALELLLCCSPVIVHGKHFWSMPDLMEDFWSLPYQP